MEQREEFVDKGSPDKVCRLNKAFYGLIQVGRGWNCTINVMIKQLDFRRLKSENCIYVKGETREYSIVMVVFQKGRTVSR